MRNYSFCKKDYKDEINNKFESYLNDREINKNQNITDTSSQFQNQANMNTNIDNNKNINISTKKEVKKEVKKETKQEYNKEEFLDEIMRIHNDVYFNPYKILEIDKEYTPETLKEKYKIAALKYHPDKGGDVDTFKDVTQSYIYLLKKYKENLPDKQIYELKDEFETFTKEQKDNKNIMMKDRNFNLENFNNVFNDNCVNKTNGYDDFMKNGETSIKEENDSYIFSDKFNLSIFNKIFNTKSKKTKKDSIVVYKEPETIFQSNNGFSKLDEDEEDVDDFTSGFTFNQKIHYTDCKRAYTSPEDLSNIDISAFDSMDDLEKHRSNISYTMNNEDSEKYNNYIELEKIKEQQRLKKIEKRDMGILKKYRKLNNIMLEK